MNITASWTVQIGSGKAACEDHALILPLNPKEEPQIINGHTGSIALTSPALIAVADGVGGNPGGHEASCFVMNRLSEVLKTKVSVANEQKLKDIVNSINQELIKYASELATTSLNGDATTQEANQVSNLGKERMATTLVAALIDAQQVLAVNVGNSRLYALNGCFMKQLTHDHTTYQLLLDQGRPEDAEHCNKCEITSCLGGGKAGLAAWLQVYKVATADRMPKTLILTSDGIHEFISEDKFEELMSMPDITDEHRAQLIAQEARNNGSEDDISIVIIRLTAPTGKPVGF